MLSTCISELALSDSNNLLTNVTIRSKVEHGEPEVFSKLAPLTHVMFNNSDSNRRTS